VGLATSSAVSASVKLTKKATPARSVVTPEVTGRQLPASGNGRWLAVGQDRVILSSRDGLDWTFSPAPYCKNLESVAYVNGLWIAGCSSSAVLTSADASTWTVADPGAGPETGEVHSVAFREAAFIGVGPAVILSSSDGRTWARKAEEHGADLRSVAFGKGRFVAVGATRC
jgi:hypothetical protein